MRWKAEDGEGGAGSPIIIFAGKEGLEGLSGIPGLANLAAVHP